MKFRHPFDRLLSSILIRRAKTVARLVSPYLSMEDKVLDVGCGDLRIGEEIKQQIDVTWIGIDTIDYNKSGLEFHLFDGRKLPFESGKFTTVFLCFILHHCDSLEPLLSECVRVADRRIIILEDVMNNRPFNKSVTKLHDRAVNWLVDPRIKCPYRFKTMKEWIDIFRERRFESIAVQKIKTHQMSLIDQRLIVFEKR
jgi:ubiquinone/menaquinone biosynthesis C-methylase UbiE